MLTNDHQSREIQFFFSHKNHYTDFAFDDIKIAVSFTYFIYVYVPWLVEFEIKQKA